MTTKKILLVGLLVGNAAQDLCALSDLARNDAYPVFSTLDPHNFLYTREKMDLKGLDYGANKYESIGLSISPFGQTADLGKELSHSTTGDIMITVPLGDIQGRWSMIPTVFNNGNACGNGTYPCDLSCTLTAARTALFPETAKIYGSDPSSGDYSIAYNTEGFNNPNAIDPAQNFGFFSSDLKYTKRGVRLEFDANIMAGFGFSIQAGYADIYQTLIARYNKTCEASCSCDFDLKDVDIPDELRHTRAFTVLRACDDSGKTVDNFTNLTTDNVNKYLMDEIRNIARESCYDIFSFHDAGVEEVRLNLYWRKALEVNKDRKGFPKLLFIPYMMVSGSFSPMTINPNKIYAAPFGNNGHNAFGFTGGLNFDFFQSLEIGAEGGFTHFNSREICNFHVPNSPLQQGFYPFSTTVNYSPGNNTHFAAKIAAQHFLDKLSMYFQFVIVHHNRDCIQVKDSQCSCGFDGADKEGDSFRPDVLEKRSDWKTKVGNCGLNYDISPNIALGFLWQAPLSQSGTYRSSTVMVSFNGTY